ncbi:MAG: metallophosphoesterase [Chloroflexota bacterium]
MSRYMTPCRGIRAVLIALLALTLVGCTFGPAQGDAPQLGTPTETVAPLPPTKTPTAVPSSTPLPTATTIPLVRFAVIGDFGVAGDDLANVAKLVKSWDVDFIITTGDNNYPWGSAETIDENIGQYYHRYISPYQGSYGEDTGVNRFFPSLGNHDWYTDGAQPYLDYFTLPGNERYYQFSWGMVDFFVLDSDWNEPDGIGKDSIQAAWLKEALAASTAPWQLVYFHMPPYSSGDHGPTTHMRWPFAEWGADAVLAGHDHDYERLEIDGLVYFINGLGGGARYGFGETAAGSQVRYQARHGAMLVVATFEEISFSFINVDGEVIDQFSLSQ